MPGLGEFELIRRFFVRPGVPVRAMLGIGDDCALLAPADGALAAVAAGTIASRKGSDSVAPRPRRTVRRESALRVM